MKKLKYLFPFLILFLVSCGGNNKNKENANQTLSPAAESELLNKARSIFGMLPDKMPGNEADTPDMIVLGKKLFMETKLSVNNTQSCNSCHDLANGFGADGKANSPGALTGKMGKRNSPTVLNAGFQFTQFWDGRAKNLEEQAKGPILSQDDMAMASEKDAVKAISSIPEYKELFSKAFPNDDEQITFNNIIKAIAAFERTLISKSRFDKYVGGDQSALTNDEKTGLQSFISIGCNTCHFGPLLGGTMYQKMGLMIPYENTTDLGRYEVTNNESEKFVFKVPQLRNIAKTAPYFHDGKVATLKEAIIKMAKMNLGRNMTDNEAGNIEKFLGALTEEKAK